MQEIKIFLDENLPPKLAQGLDIILAPYNSKINIDCQIKSIKTEYGQGTLDEDWIPKIGAICGIVITQDFNLQRIKTQNELYHKHGVGLIIVRPPSKTGLSYWEIVKLLINKWDDIIKICIKNITPFAYTISVKGKVEKIS